MTEPEPPTAGRPSIAGLLARVIDVRPGEIRALLWSCAYFFTLLSSYYIIRPLRETMGVAGGVRNLPWLFTGTLVAMLLVHPPFAALVSKLPRRWFVAVTYRFFTVSLLIFFGLLTLVPEAHQIWLGRVFFVWTSVFNLFVVSVFWGFMADIFSARQGRRLFGFIGLGGTLGAIVGSALTSQLAPVVGTVNLLLVSALLLELATLAVRRLSASAVPAASPADPTPDPDAIIGGSVLAGVTHVGRSPYLLGICGYMLLFSVGSTVLYFQQAEFASATYAEPALRTAFFARLDLAVNVLTLVTQAFLTGRIVKLLGVAGTMTLLPILSVVGFLTLGASHTVAVFVVFQVLRRAGQFAVARPTVEVLYTVVSREDKYKAKNLIDTFVYRAGDQMGAWSYALVASLGLASASIAFLTAPIAGLWLLIAVWLGRRHEVMASTPGTDPKAATAAPA